MEELSYWLARSIPKQRWRKVHHIWNDHKSILLNLAHILWASWWKQWHQHYGLITIDLLLNWPSHDFNFVVNGITYFHCYFLIENIYLYLFCVDHTQARRCKEKTFYIYRTCEEGFWKVFQNLTIPLCHHWEPLWIGAYGYNLWNHGCLCYFPQYCNKRWKIIMLYLCLNKQIYCS